MSGSANQAVQHALVLSGGGGRGAYQVGVCQVLEEMSWHPDLVLGNSIGATNGAMLIAPHPDLNLSGIELLQQVWHCEMSNKVLHQASSEWPGYVRWAINLVMKILQALQKPPKSAEADELFLELIEELSVDLAGVEREKVSLMSVVQKVLAKPSLMDRDGWQRLLEQKVDFRHLKFWCRGDRRAYRRTAVLLEPRSPRCRGHCVGNHLRPRDGQLKHSRHLSGDVP
jgi:NTE family protein